MQADTQDSDVATEQTVRLMCEHVHRAARDPLVRQTAHQAAKTWGQFGPTVVFSAEPRPAQGCFWWAKHYVKAVPHSQFKALLAAYPEKRQLLVAPEVVLRAPNPAGDCSTFSMFLASMLESLGIGWELVTVAVDPEDPSLYSHVFVRAVFADGRRITLDGSHGKYPGWEVPRAHQLRRQVWDCSGEPVDDEAVVVSQLHEYRARGLGDDTSTTDLSGLVSEVTGGTASVMPFADYSGIESGLPADWAYTGLTTTNVSGVTGAVALSQSSANWAAFAAALAKGGMTLAEINAIQPGTVVGANGQILRQSAGYAVPVGGVTASLGSGSTTLWLIAGLGVLAFLFVAMKKS
jgi:hypothetical protein